MGRTRFACGADDGRESPGLFDNDVGNWGLTMAGAYHVLGDMNRARAYADSARAGFEQQLKAAPEDGTRLALLGVAHPNFDPIRNHPRFKKLVEGTA